MVCRNGTRCCFTIPANHSAAGAGARGLPHGNRPIALAPGPQDHLPRARAGVKKAEIHQDGRRLAAAAAAGNAQVIGALERPEPVRSDLDFHLVAARPGSAFEFGAGEINAVPEQQMQHCFQALALYAGLDVAKLAARVAQQRQVRARRVREDLAAKHIEKQPLPVLEPLGDTRAGLAASDGPSHVAGVIGQESKTRDLIGNSKQAGSRQSLAPIGDSRPA